VSFGSGWVGVGLSYETQITGEIMTTVAEVPRVIGYHERDELSSSEVATYLNDPIEWYHLYVKKDWKKEVTDAMKFGTAIHSMIEHGGSETIVKEIPESVLNADGHCKGKPWLDWKRDNPAEMYLKPGEPNPLKIIWEHLQANSFCKYLMQVGKKEVEHFWDDPDMGACRMKMDVSTPVLFADWKTTTKTCPRTFAADAFSRFYDVRLAFYRMGFRDLHGCNPEVYIVSICTTGGMKVTPFLMPDAWLEEAEARLILAVDDMARFDIRKYLDSDPVALTKPAYATLDLESVE